MSSITIAYKTKTPFIEALLEEENIEEFKAHTLFKKLTFAVKTYPDIYFHQGKIDKSSLDWLKHSKITVVNSQHTKKEIIQQLHLEAHKVEVIYPCFTPKEIIISEAKKEFLAQLQLDKQTKIIFFTAKNLKANGIKEFIHTILNLHSTNFRVIIASDSQQITNLRFQISKYNFEDKVLLYENFDNMDLLFAIADIFVLPTHNQSFASNILKAMYYKTAVFVPEHNACSELVDVFATMHTPNDPSTAFKIDALLSRNEDLKVIKKQNHKIAKQLTVQKELEKFNLLIEKIKGKTS
jgi:glycosyltransferase involved in cell wall biosynthesis